MKHSNGAKPGYIIMLTLLIIAAAVALITAVVQQAFTYQRQFRLTAERVQSRMLALSSLEFALCKISLVIPKEKEEKGEKKKDDADSKKKGALEPLQKWLMEILPSINKWQKFEFKQEADGFEGAVSLYISSEQGKINLNAFEQEPQEEQADKDKKQSDQEGAQEEKPGEQSQKKEKKTQDKKGSLDKVNELFRKEKEVSIKDALMRFKAEFKRPPEDPTELLRIKQFARIGGSLFVTQEEVKRPIFLMDLFTVAPGNAQLNPWLFTRSLKTLLQLPEKKDAKITKELVKKMKPSMNWESDWDTILAPIYGKKYAELDKEITSLLGSEFEATGFSVVSYCTVGGITQKIYAVLELAEPPADVSPKSLIYSVAKLYWI